MAKRNQGRAIRDSRIVDNDNGTNETIAHAALRTGLTPNELIRLNRLAWALVVRYDFSAAHDASVPVMPLAVAATVVFDEWLDSPQSIDYVKPTISGYWAD